MAHIPRKTVDEYTDALNKLSADVQKRLFADLERIDFTGDVALIRDAIIERMEFYLGPYTDMAAIVAAEFYDEVRTLSVGEKLGAYAESGREPKATEQAVRGIMQDVVDGKAPEAVALKLVGRADYEIKKAAGECVYINGARDPKKPRFARVPSGSETCKFCIMLASRGFVYRNAKTAGEGSHYHAGCDCRIVPGFGKDPTVEGYDPDEYLYLDKGMETCAISDDKCQKYLLNMEHPDGKNKAILFEKYLGFKQEDSAELKKKLYIAGGKYKFVYRDADEHGERFTQNVVMTGKDGKKAQVEIGWIKRPGSDKISLVTAIPRREIK